MRPKKKAVRQDAEERIAELERRLAAVEARPIGGGVIVIPSPYPTPIYPQPFPYPYQPYVPYIQPMPWCGGTWCGTGQIEVNAQSANLGWMGGTLANGNATNLLAQ